MTGRTAAGAAISLEGVGKAFDVPGGARVHALDDVTLHVEPGAIFIGNGSDEAIDLLFRIFCAPGADEAKTG